MICKLATQWYYAFCRRACLALFQLRYIRTKLHHRVYVVDMQLFPLLIVELGIGKYLFSNRKKVNYIFFSPQ